MFPALRVDQSSISKLENNLLRVYGILVERSKGALYASANDIMRESRLECPRDTSTLVNSAYVSIPEVKGDDIYLHMGYASPETDRVNPFSYYPASFYAVDVHENVLYYHPHGKHHFLRDPVLLYSEAYVTKLRDALREVLGGWYERFVGYN